MTKLSRRALPVYLVVERIQVQQETATGEVDRGHDELDILSEILAIEERFSRFRQQAGENG